MDPERGALPARLALIHQHLDHPPGVMLGVRRLPVLDPILDELEGLAGEEGRGGSGAAANGPPTISREVILELEQMAELLSREMLGTAPEALVRRVRIVELLRRADDGRLPSLVADSGDPFGHELRAMLESDDELRVCLGRLYPLVIRATTAAPAERWLRDARDVASAPDGPALASATSRVLASLVRAPIASRPDLLIGGLRLANQRFARGLLWFASVALPAPADVLGTVGLRMGTSGRADAVVRDIALANTCAALLGDSSDPGAATALASMRSQITNRVVLKQVDRVLERLATRAGKTVDELVDLALPAFGLDERGRIELEAGAASATLQVTPDARVILWWRLADGSEVPLAPDALATAEPEAVADVARRVSTIESAVSEERRRLEGRLGSVRAWPEADWRRRFLEHPIGGVFGRRLVWVLGRPDGSSVAVLPEGEGWIGVDEQEVRVDGSPASVRLWHPVEAGSAAVAAWRATLAAGDVRQPFRQVDREVFVPATTGVSPTADRRFMGRIVDHAQLRALLRGRDWAVPALGAWDQGDEATAWRVFDDGLRAELLYQSVDRVPTGERVERARLVAVRFVRTDTAPTSHDEAASGVALDDVPGRTFSEAIRDVSLAVVVGEEPAPR